MRLGMKHDRWLSTEITGIWVHTFKAAGDEFLAWGVGMGERLYFTRTRWQPYAQLTAGFLQVRGKSTDPTAIGFSPRFGLGVDYYTTEDLALTLSINYHLTVGAISGADFVTVGLGFQWF
jgi:hypothetical protein